MRYFLSILLVTLFFSCKNERIINDKNFFYPNKFDLKKGNRLIIDIDSKNQNKIFNYLDSINCLNKQVPILKVKKNNLNYFFYAKQFCDNNQVISCYKDRNVISISTDSIYVSYIDRYPIDSLKSILKKHLINKNKSFDFPENLNKASIFFKINNNKKNLIKLADEFNKLNSISNDSLKLNIVFKESLFEELPKTFNPPKPSKVF